MGGRSYQIGIDYGPAWCKKRKCGTLEMEPHSSMMMRIIVPWMERQRKGKGINLNPKDILVKQARRRTSQRLNVFIVIIWDTMP